MTKQIQQQWRTWAVVQATGHGEKYPDLPSWSLGSRSWLWARSHLAVWPVWISEMTPWRCGCREELHVPQGSFEFKVLLWIFSCDCRGLCSVEQTRSTSPFFPSLMITFSGFRVDGIRGLRRRLQLEVGGCYTWWSTCILWFRKPPGMCATKYSPILALSPYSSLDLWNHWAGWCDPASLLLSPTSYSNYSLFRPAVWFPLLWQGMVPWGTSPRLWPCPAVIAKVLKLYLQRALREADDTCLQSLCTPLRMHPRCLSYWAGQDMVITHAESQTAWSRLGSP